MKKKKSNSILIIGVLGVIAFVGWNIFFSGTSSNCSSWKSKDTWTNCFGEQKMANGAYEGHYLNGKFDGQGTFTWSDGDKYVGEWKDGERHGLGTFTWTNGAKYVGEYKDSKQHGQGTYTWTNGDKYIGEWKDGERHGQGTKTWGSGEFSGDKYVGEYKNDERHGQGLTHMQLDINTLENGKTVNNTD